MSLIGEALKVTTLPQKIAFGGVTALLLASATFSTVKVIDNHRLAAANSKLDARINDPKTGYVVRLTQATTNTEVCVAAVKRQTAAIKAEGVRTAATATAVQTRYNVDHANRVRAENASAALLAQKPQGETVLDRVNDVDAQILEDLK